MLGFLPRPAADELLYSILARYRLFTADGASSQTLKSAFGPNHRYIQVGLPGRLRHLAANLPGSLWTADKLAYDHTLLPYYQRFASPRLSGRLVAGVMEGWTKGVCEVFVRQANRHPTLNFCPDCVAADKNAVGMSVWHRVHQLPGVFICPEHGSELRTTGVMTTLQTQLIQCPDEPLAGEPVPALLDRPAAESVARNSLWLLRNHSSPTDRTALRAGVRAMLRDAGWIRQSNIVRPGLRQAVADKLGASHLDKLGCSLPPVGNRAAWLCWTWEELPEIRAHPLRYLLLLAFLERNAADLFAFVDMPLPDDSPVIVSRMGGLTQQPVPRTVIQKHRDRVLLAIRSWPDASRTEIRKLAGRSTRYLALYDQEWIEANLPPERSKAKPRDWADFDRRLLPEVDAAIARLRAQPGRPVRITQTAIAILAGGTTPLLSARERLPLCAAAIRAAAENDLTFCTRRLHWAVNEMMTSGEDLVWTRLALLGGLYGPIRPLLEDYARDLFETMLAAKSGHPIFPLGSQGLPGPPRAEKGGTPSSDPLRA